MFLKVSQEKHLKYPLLYTNFKLAFLKYEYPCSPFTSFIECFLFSHLSRKRIKLVKVDAIFFLITPEIPPDWLLKIRLQSCYFQMGWGKSHVTEDVTKESDVPGYKPLPPTIRNLFQSIRRGDFFTSTIAAPQRCRARSDI